MRKSFSLETVLVVLSALALMIALLAPSSTGTAFASENDAPAKTPDQLAAEAQEAYMKTLVEEGSKLESRSTSGVVSDAAGLYFEKGVTGVAIKANAGASLAGTTVSVADTNTSKSIAAMGCVNNAAAANGLTVGPSIDIYAKGTGTAGTITNMGAVYVGLPASFIGGSSYSAIVVAPGGSTTVLPATLTPDGKSVVFDLNGLTGTARTASQLLVSICRK